jgi:hypothetical protein
VKLERFEELRGQVLRLVRNDDNRRIVFELEDGSEYELYHGQDCCESVHVEDIAGDLSDLVGEVVVAEESSNRDNPPEHAESHTWTFYRIGTVKGTCVIRWLGESNGYYSESVDFAAV